MKIVINIDDEDYKRIQDIPDIFNSLTSRVYSAIKNGTPLPKEQESKTEWIPCSDPLNELPKDRMLYVTTRWGYVETLYWDMTEWNDKSIARNTIAYMDYYEPQPYISCKK